MAAKELELKWVLNAPPNTKLKELQTLLLEKLGDGYFVHVGKHKGIEGIGIYTEA